MRATEHTARRAPIAMAAMWLAIYAVPILVVPGLQESFRLPKLLVAEWLGLASLLALAIERGVPRFDARAVAQALGTPRAAVVRAVAPFLLIAAASLATTSHPLHVKSALISLGIGAACLIGWTYGFDRGEKERLLRGSLAPMALLALLAVLQFLELWEPLRFAGIAADARLGVTSLAGNPGDLGAYLVLPILIAVAALARSARVWTAIVLALGAYALLATQTLAALAALAAGLFVWAVLSLPRRRLLAALGATLVIGGIGLAAVAPLRTRVAEKVGKLAQGNWNDLLTGRLDGWRGALHMLAAHPLAGVGHGAFRPEFAPAKLALASRGVPFYAEQRNPVFANAHNEYLEVAADLGWPGVAVLAWGIGVVLVALLRRPDPDADSPRASDRRSERRSDRALALAAVAAYAVLALAYFPFRTALVAYPALLLLAWALDPREEA